MDNTSTVNLHTGRAMPIIGLGTWQMTEHTRRTVEDALGLGYPMIDTAVDYETQPEIGAAFERGGSSPSETYLVSRVGENEDAYEATKRNLRELGTGAIDLTLIHRPPTNGAGVEMWEGLIRARGEGLTTDIGVSNYSTGQIDEIADATDEMPTVNQIEMVCLGATAAKALFGSSFRITRERGTLLPAPDLEGVRWPTATLPPWSPPCIRRRCSVRTTGRRCTTVSSPTCGSRPRRLGRRRHLGQCAV